MNDPRRVREESRQEYHIASETTGEGVHAPPHGRLAMLLAGLIIGILLLGLQLWLLTVALNQYLLGQINGAWELLAISGLIFLGGIVVWRTMDQQASTQTKEK